MLSTLMVIGVIFGILVLVDAIIFYSNLVQKQFEASLS